jgi:DNA-binding transcriptional ArsR family regulator
VTSSNALPDQLAQELDLLHNRVCRAIGDPKRLMILYALHERPRYVVELAEALGYPQPTISRHLAALHNGGLVIKERHGQTVIYSLSDARIIAVLDIMRAMLRDMAQETARVTSTASAQDDAAPDSDA